jgi:hypothetical protein
MAFFPHSEMLHAIEFLEIGEGIYDKQGSLSIENRGLAQARW